MNEKLEKMHIITEKYFKEIEIFGSNSQKARDASLKRYKLEESKIPKLSEFRLMLDGLILSVSQNFHTPPALINENISYRIGLCASYLRTHFIINDLILSGDIIEATTLVRKQLEAFTRLNELEKKEISKLQKKTPNVNNTFNGVTKELYSKLSEIAHSGSDDVVDLISNFEENNNRSEVNIYPLYSSNSLQCYKFHCYIALGFVSYFIKFAQTIYDYNDAEDIEMFLILLEIHGEIDFLNNK
jgi:hypothetical protein